MINRLSAFASALIGCCLVASANQTFNVEIDAAKTGISSPEGANPRVTFECLHSDFANGTARIRVSVENVSKEKALLFFPEALGKKTLKNYKPKITFVKNYSGGDVQAVDKKMATRYSHPNVIIVTENDKDTIGSFTVTLGQTDTITLPFYIASYDHKKLTKAREKNLPNPKEQIAYQISREDIYEFVITANGWSEHDPTYKSLKADVDNLIASLDSASFCPNAKHPKSLSKQQKPYKDEITRLKAAIDSILAEGVHGGNKWMSHDLPHKMYTALIARLNSINLSSYNKDCGNHPIVPPIPVNRPDTTLELYHQIADTYTKLRADRISKNAAVKEAQRIKNCASRCKKGRYLRNINEYYNRIINY